MIFCSTENECELYSTENKNWKVVLKFCSMYMYSGDLDAFGKSVHKRLFPKMYTYLKFTSGLAYPEISIHVVKPCASLKALVLLSCIQTNFKTS